VVIAGECADRKMQKKQKKKGTGEREEEEGRHQVPQVVIR
jgi:hypothetical protein